MTGRAAFSAADPAIEVIFNYELNDEHHPALAGKDDGWGLTYGPEGGFGKKAAYHDFKKLLADPYPYVSISRGDVGTHVVHQKTLGQIPVHRVAQMAFETEHHVAGHVHERRL